MLLAFCTVTARRGRTRRWLRALFFTPILLLLVSHPGGHPPVLEYLQSALLACAAVFGVALLGQWLLWTIRPDPGPRARLTAAGRRGFPPAHWRRAGLHRGPRPELQGRGRVPFQAPGPAAVNRRRSGRCGSRSNRRWFLSRPCAIPSCAAPQSATGRCRGSPRRGRPRKPGGPALRRCRGRRCRHRESATTCMPCGPFRASARVPAPWQAVHSVIVPAWPCTCCAATLSLWATVGFGQIACVLLWQPSQATPPWPLLKR